MGKKRIKAAVALATAAVTATVPGSYMPGLMTALAAEQNSADLKVVNTSVSPGNGQVYHGAKIFTFETSVPIQSPGDGWRDVSDSMTGTKWAKEFTTNQKFTLTIRDLDGHSITTPRYEVKNIEAETLNPEVSYSTSAPTQENVVVTIETGMVECKTPSGWEKVGAKRNTFQKTYTDNENETVTLVSLGGQEASAEISVRNIDREAPSVIDITYSPDNGQMSRSKVVTIIADEPIESPAADWIKVEESNGTKWEKTYTQAMKDSVTLKDLAGNESASIPFEVKRIEDVDLAAEVIYSNNGQYTNQDVTVTIKTNVECHTPEGWTQIGSKRNQFEKTYSADTVETVKLVSLAEQVLNQNVEVVGIDKVAPKAFINGTNPIDESNVYNYDINLKFNDNAALDHYVLNGHENPTNIFGNLWGDGNYVNIKGYLNVNGENTLTVWDRAGNSSTYTFRIDQVGPVVQVEVEDPDIVTPTKTVTLTGNEPFKMVDNDQYDNLWFNPLNADQDGYATIWTASATKAISESFAVEDKLGNQSTVAVNVSNVNSIVPEATVIYTNTEPTTNDVPVQITWNTALSQESVQILEKDGWKQNINNPLIFVKIFKENATLTYNNIKNDAGVPGKKLVITVNNIDRTGPAVTAAVENPDIMTPTKTVTLTGDEPFKVVDNTSHSKLWFIPYNDDDNDGYATEWRASATTPIFEGYTVEDKLGNQSTVAVYVTNVDSLVPEATINYTVTEPTTGVVPVEITWNTGLSAEFEKQLEEEGWEKTHNVPPTFVRIFRENETLTYTNVESQSGVPGKALTVTVNNIITEKEIGINYWDVVNNRQAGEGKIVVDGDATTVSINDLIGILPEGYELAEDAETVNINDGWIYVQVRPVVTTQEVGVNYWDVENDKQAGEGKVTVSADATSVNTSALTDIPEGYELATTGDITINGGWIYVEVRPAEKEETTQEVGVNYWDVENNEQVCEGKVTVSADAAAVNTSALTDIPEGYELATTGDITINGGWIYVEVRPVATTQEVGVNYWDVENDKHVDEGKVTVSADATSVNTSALTDIPEGYELATTGDITIYGGWIFVDVRPIKEEAATQEVEIIFVDEATKENVGDTTITLDKEATVFNVGILESSVPEGYELAESGDVFINEEGATEIKVRLVEEEEGMEAILIINFVDPFGGDVDVEPVVVAENGPEGGYAIFNYGEDWELPEGYDFAEDFDEMIAKQEFRVKYGHTLDTVEIGIVPEEEVKELKKAAAEFFKEAEEEPEETVSEAVSEDAADEAAVEKEESEEESEEALTTEETKPEKEAQEEAEAEEEVQEEAEPEEEAQEEAEAEETAQEEKESEEESEEDEVIKDAEESQEE